MGAGSWASVTECTRPRTRGPAICGSAPAKLGEKMGQPHWFQILPYLEEKVMVPYRERGIYVNVDFFAGSIYYLLGLPEDLFSSIFALGRIPGWTLQCVEQYKDNVLIRPLLDYRGPLDLEYVPIEARG